ncbi:dCTP deaminase [Histomonas meleagridis]|uniref:dCTP deaminase n=1 Tax=Histomonas meleagridis TaxID=135588 RepID=UPI00355A847C|nr:dCTP deaminase [Histomonas meleagridis]KAH0800250.1 dCTP deaminase [Histomonas meleagridis]
MQVRSSDASTLCNIGCVLTHDAIIEEIKKGNIEISEPFKLENVGPASVDLTLGNEFRIFLEDETPITLEADVDYRSEKITKLVHVEDGEGFLLKPFTSCLGITKETVKLPPNMCGLLEGRSRMARLGLLIHFTASLMAPGINNRQVLEICNLSPRPLILKPGVKVCQFVFIRAEGEYTYNGSWSNQKL